MRTGAERYPVLPRRVNAFQEWWSIPVAARVYALLVVAAALAVSVGSLSVLHTTPDTAVLFLAIVGVAIANSELGRLVEGGRVYDDRANKGLSAWPFAAALVLPVGLAGWVAICVFSHARLRGMKVALWKWTGTWASITLSAFVAGLVFQTAQHGALPADGSARVLGLVAAVAVIFVAVEAAVSCGFAYLNTAKAEAALRRWLAEPDFYLTEFGVLATGAVTAVLLTYWLGFVLVTVPIYAVMQRAMVHDHLKHEATHDGKTGLLNSETWRTVADYAVERARSSGSPLAVLMMDLDHFKDVNDVHGHLFGDVVLTRTADALMRLTRGADVVGRFGGEEFCLVLHNSEEEARAAGERIRSALAALRFQSANVRVTTSIGIAMLLPGDELSTLDDLVAAADRALYRAKQAGRNRVFL